MSEFKPISEYECLIMGDSQTQRINPEYFTTKTYNLASSGEHFYFTLQKIKKIIRCKNHKTKQIILGVSTHNFAPVYSKYFDTQFPEGKYSLVKYFYFIDVQEFIHKVIEGKEFIRKDDLFCISNVKSVLFGDPDMGGLFKSDLANPDSSIINETLKRQYGTTKSYSLSQVKYLKEIVKLCSKNKIDVYLISTPYHPYYLSKVDDYYFKIFNKTISELDNVTYISYITPNFRVDFMADANHLNTKGSDVISKMINDTIVALKYNKRELQVRHVIQPETPIN
jgi:hypothetical protein